MTLSIVMITFNSADVIGYALESVVGLWDELLVGDGGSTDGTVEIVKKYGGIIIRQIRPILPIRPMNETMIPNDKNSGMRKKNIGERKQELVEKAKGDWILVLDADERVSEDLGEEIKRLIDSKTVRPSIAYRIPYQNYVFGRRVYHGGEGYAKVRLFRRGFAKISPDPLHEEVIVKNGKVGELRGVICHFSYRSPWQLFAKFTKYAWIAAREKKRQGETLSLKKLFLYGPHMFWARFINEKGYKDGWRGLILAFSFGYMEGLTYWLVIITRIKK